MTFIFKYLLYLLRWQLSTPLLAGVLYYLSNYDITTATIIANLIGGLLFFWVDRFIFTGNILSEIWEVKENTKCVDCKKDIDRGYRLVYTKGYDRRHKKPEFRCEECSIKKYNEIKRI